MPEYLNLEKLLMDEYLGHQISSHATIDKENHQSRKSFSLT